MTATVIKGMSVFSGALDLSLNAQSFDGPNVDVEAVDVTAVGDTHRRVIAGLRNFTLACNGLTDFDSDAVDEAVSWGGLATARPFTITPGGDADGARCYLAEGLALTFKNGMQVGQAASFDLTAQGRGRNIARGKVLHPKTARSTSSNGTGQQLGAVSATQQVNAALHVFATSGTGQSLIVKVQSDDNSGFTTPTDRITFATAGTTITSEFKTLAGAITDTYWRVTWTIAGSTPSFTFAASVGIS